MNAAPAPCPRRRPVGRRRPLTVETVVTHDHAPDVLAYARVAAGVLARMAQQSRTASPHAA